MHCSLQISTDLFIKTQFQATFLVANQNAYPINMLEASNLTKSNQEKSCVLVLMADALKKNILLQFVK